MEEDSGNCATKMGEHIKNFLADNRDIDLQLGQNGHLSLFVSDVTDQFKKIAEMTLKTNITFETVRI